MVALLAVGWVTGSIVQDLFAREKIVALDQPVARSFASHRTPAAQQIAAAVVAAFVLPCRSGRRPQRAR